MKKCLTKKVIEISLEIIEFEQLEFKLSFTHLKSYFVIIL